MSTASMQRFQALAEASEEASEALKSIANPLRLQILCHLASGERTVQELEELLGISQSNVSQQLGRLRDRQVVSCRREGRNLYYSIKDARFITIISAIKKVFCPD